MAKVTVTSDDGRVVVDIKTNPLSGYVWADCRACGASLADGGHFEDTVRGAEIHVDRAGLHRAGPSGLRLWQIR